MPAALVSCKFMVEGDGQRLRVLVANESRDRLDNVAEVVGGLGHDVIRREVDVVAAAAATTTERPDVALVGLGDRHDHALEMIEQIVRQSVCPVIALLWSEDAAFIRQAARRGIFACIVDTAPGELQSAIDITLQRFAEYHNLQRAFARRAEIEQAKGILMARHTINADTAFDMLREHSHNTGVKLAEVAAAIVHSHHLLHLAEERPSARAGDP